MRSIAGCSERFRPPPCPFALTTDWYLDPADGSDESSGKTASAALKTPGALEARIGHYTCTLRPAGGTLAIHLLSSLPDPQLFNLLAVLGPDVIVVVQADRTLEVEGASGIIGSVTTLDRSAGSMHRWSLTCAGIDFTALAKKRLRIVSGPDEGTWVWIDSGGPNFAVVSAPSVTDEPYVFTLTPTSLTAGDEFVVEDLLRLPKGAVSSVATASLTRASAVVFKDLEIVDPAPGTYANVDGSFTATVAYVGCKLNGTGTGVESTAFFSNCLLADGFYEWTSGVNSFVLGGLMKGMALVVGTGACVTMNEDALISESYLDVDGTLTYGLLGVFDSPGDGVYVGTGGVLARLDPGDQKLYGDGNAGFGVEVAGKATLAIDPTNASTLPSITGTSGDLSMGGKTSIRPFDDVAGSYAAAVACAWTNFTPAPGPGVFGPSVLDPNSGAAVVSV